MANVKIYPCVAFLVLMMLMALTSPATAGDGQLVVKPEHVQIYSLFSGVQMHISADLPEGSQAVLEVRGKRIEEELMRKSRHWDLWMNSGEVDIENAPLLYMAFSTNPDLLSPGAADLPWGYAALERNSSFAGRIKPVEDVMIFNEFVELKERDKLYRLYPGGLKINQPKFGHWRAEADFHLPSKIKPGQYKVKLSVIRNGKVAEIRTGSFDVQMAGMPELLRSMAKQHGVFYGFLAVGIAMVVGMLTGLAFHRGGGGH